MCVPCHDQASYIAAYTMNWPFKNMLPGSVDGSPSLRALRNCGSSLAKPSAQPQIKCWSLFPGPAPVTPSPAAAFLLFFSSCAAYPQTSRPFYDCINALISVLAYFFLEPYLASCGGLRSSPFLPRVFTTPGFDQRHQVEQAQTTIAFSLHQIHFFQS
jgi:hypothetical protein